MQTSLLIKVLAAGLIVAGCGENEPRCVGGAVHSDAGLCECPRGTTWHSGSGSCDADVDGSAGPAAIQDETGLRAGAAPEKLPMHDGGQEPLPSEPATDASTLDAGATEMVSDASRESAVAADTGASANVILDLASHQPPSSIPAGSWPAQMRNGHFRFSWTPSFPSSAIPTGRADGGFSLFEFGDAITDTSNGQLGNRLALEKQGTACAALLHVYPYTYLIAPALEFEAGKPIEYEIDLPRGTWTIRGASSGNGTLSAGGALSWPDGTLYVGKSTDPEIADFAGTISNVEGLP